MNNFKKITLGLLGAILLTFTLYSCTSDNSTPTNEVNTILSKNEPSIVVEDVIANANAYLKYDNKYIFANADENDLEYLTSFDGQFNFSHYTEFGYPNPLNYTIEENGNNILILNNITNESIELSNIKLVNGVYNFDISGNNKKIVNAKFSENIETHVSQKCPWCWVAPAVALVIEAIGDATSESDCQTAVNACVKAGGLPSTKIEEGWFGNSCTVTCAPKPKTIKKK